MNANKLIICLCLIACPMVIAGTVSAGNQAKAFTMSPSIGGYMFEDDQGLDDGTVFGLGLGYNLDSHWTAEAVFHYIDTEHDGSSRSVDAWFYHLDALYHFNPSERLVPFLAAGIGSLVVDTNRSHYDKDFAVNYGGGLKYYLTKDVALRGDVRHVISFSSVHNNFLYTVGLTFSFGKLQ